MRVLHLCFGIALLALGGCAVVPAPIAGKDFAALTPAQAAAQNARGTHVRWGGEIIKVDPKSDTTCFEVLSRTLYTDARPNRRDGSDGRFMACANGFYDPEVYRKGRDLTVIGQVTGTEQHNVGEHAYTYASVSADGIYLWPKRTYPEPFYDPWGPYLYDPFLGPFGGYGGYWSPPVVIYHGPPAGEHH
jgi:outer membrane lipoprotein